MPNYGRPILFSNVNERILIVEDDLNMARVLSEGLAQESYAVTLASNGPKGLEQAQTGRFDGIVLDVLLPGLDGRSLARTLREKGIATPILMLTALDTVSDIVAGLDAGAEDYLTKPFSFLELLARLRSLVRRAKPTPACMRVADLIMDTAAHSVTRSGEPINLTKTEYLLLEVLMRNAGHVVARSEIAQAVWGSGSTIEQNSIDVYIKALRAKIDRPFAQKLIETMRGFGYKLAPGREETP